MDIFRDMFDPPSAPAPQRVSLPWRLTLASLDRLPQGALSRLFGMLADLPLPRWARPVVIGTFARLAGVAVEEADQPILEYPSLNAFFVRRLEPGVHRWTGRPEVVASPVDGVIGAFGAVREGTLVQAKGLNYTASELLGDDDQARVYEGGSFLTLYLSPRHYHRIHTPMPGHVVNARHVPGRLFPVNGPSVSSIEGVFARNERLLCTLSGALGPLAIVAVGAYNVGRISAAFDPSWTGRAGGSITNRNEPPPPERRYRHPIPIEEGDELMAFHLGSTVILLVPPGAALVDGLTPGREVRVGEPLMVPDLG